MSIQHINIDSQFKNLNTDEVTAELIDTTICSLSLNFLHIKKRKKHILELITCKVQYWKLLVEEADELMWIIDEGKGLAVFYPDQDYGYIRVYNYKPSQDYNAPKNEKYNYVSWRNIKSEFSLLDVLTTPQYTHVFEAWRAYQLQHNSIPTEFAEGRLSNTAVNNAIIVTKANGCAVCGQLAGYHATTTLSENSIILLTISLCEVHSKEAIQYPSVLKFFGALFSINLNIPDLIKLDHIPDELVEPLANMLASNLKAKFDTPNKRKRGWHIVFKMQDEWSWILRLNTLTDYAYILQNPKNKQVHRIDSANHHPDIPFGPDHQHFNANTKREKIRPSFSYGVPLLDFPLLDKIKRYYIDEEK